MRNSIKIFFLIALISIIFIPHVGAENVTYSQEYYNLTHNANNIFNKCASGGDFSEDGSWAWCNNFLFQEMTSQRERAIQIALEKQNDLISEQNNLLRNLTKVKYYCFITSSLSMDYDCNPVTT